MPRPSLAELDRLCQKPEHRRRGQLDGPPRQPADGAAGHLGRRAVGRVGPRGDVGRLGHRRGRRRGAGLGNRRRVGRRGGALATLVSVGSRRRPTRPTPRRRLARRRGTGLPHAPHGQPARAAGRRLRIVRPARRTALARGRTGVGPGHDASDPAPRRAIQDLHPAAQTPAGMPRRPRRRGRPAATATADPTAARASGRVDRAESSARCTS